MIEAQKVDLVGHRGMRGSLPENTLCAFEMAIQHGVDMVELDVRRCKSGELVVMHDSTLDRVAFKKGLVKDFTLSELKKISLPYEQSVPTLEEVFQHVQRRCKINIELKGKKTALQVAELIDTYCDKHGWHYDDFIVSSFNLYELFTFKHACLSVRTGIIFEELPIDYVRSAREFGVSYLMMDYSLLTADFVSYARHCGIEIYAWTVNAQADINRLYSYGVRGVITDCPDSLKIYHK